MRVRVRFKIKNWCGCDCGFGSQICGGRVRVRFTSFVLVLGAVENSDYVAGAVENFEPCCVRIIFDPRSWIIFDPDPKNRPPMN